MRKALTPYYDVRRSVDLLRDNGKIARQLFRN